MIFEEFFLKKKIDLAQLQLADPNLFMQFKSHYSLMGEKSFDHTKKYWFNKLRHSYPLSAEEETRLKELYKGEKAVEKAEALIPETSKEVVVAKPAGFKPKFKIPIAGTENPISSDAGKPVVTTAVTGTNSDTEPAGFKPRFKPGMAKPLTTNPEDKPEIKETKESPVAKPAGFTPRFKAGTTKVSVTEADKTAKEQGIAVNKTTETAKPTGFTPRFKAGTTRISETGSVEEQTDQSATKEQSGNTPDDTVETLKPTGFTPRFKAGKTSLAGNGNRQEEKIDELAQEEDNKTQEATNPTKPLGFKPRFKAGTTNTLPDEQKEVSKTTPEDIIKKEPPSESAVNKPLGFKPRFKVNKKEE